MEYQQHSGKRLKLNHSNALPRYLVSYHVESIAEQSEINGKRISSSYRLGVAIYARMVGNTPQSIQTIKFQTPEQFWEFIATLTRPGQTVWIVSHESLLAMVLSGLTEQIEQVTLTVDWPRSKRKRETNVEDDPHQVGSVIFDSPPTIIALRHCGTGGRFVIVDIMNWFPSTLTEIGAAAGIPQLAKPLLDSDLEQWFSYALQNAQIVFTVFTELLKWHRENNFGMFKYTAAGQAMHAYRHRFMEHEILVHDNAEAKHLERRSYFGGRTEVFKLGEINETVYQLDVNALFPSVMLDYEFPTKLVRYDIGGDFMGLLPAIDWERAVAHVRIRTREPIYPMRTAKEIIYPIGEFETVLSGKELERAAKHRQIVACKSWAEYETAPIFRLWVNELWGMRQRYKEDHNTLYAEFCKRLMNSLYGKFGQLAAEWVNDTTRTAHEPWSKWAEHNMATNETVEYRSFGWLVQRLKPKRQLRVVCENRNGVETDTLIEEYNEIDTTFVAIASFVASAARCRMDHFRSLIGRKSVLYQGIDSLVVDQVGFDKLRSLGQVSDTAIGYLRLQLQCDYGQIYGCSDYLLGNKTVISGRALNSEVTASGEILQHRSAAKEMLFCGQGTRQIYSDLEPWVRQGKYKKGTVQPDGWVDPFVLGESSLSPESGSSTIS